jgi:hypothetical protein
VHGRVAVCCSAFSSWARPRFIPEHSCGHVPASCDHVKLPTMLCPCDICTTSASATTCTKQRKTMQQKSARSQRISINQTSHGLRRAITTGLLVQHDRGSLCADASTSAATPSSAPTPLCYSLATRLLQCCPLLPGRSEAPGNEHPAWPASSHSLRVRTRVAMRVRFKCCARGVCSCSPLTGLRWKCQGDDDDDFKGPC